MAEIEQHRAQFGVVVDRAVENQRQSGRGIHHRLARMVGQVDDRQPPMAEGHGTFLPEAGAIRAAPREPRVHALNGGPVWRRAVESQFTRDAAHGEAAYAPIRCSTTSRR